MKEMNFFFHQIIYAFRKEGCARLKGMESKMKRPNYAIITTVSIIVSGIIAYYLSYVSIRGIATRRNMSRRLQSWKNKERYHKGT